MHLATAVLGLVSMVSAGNLSSPQHLFANPEELGDEAFKIPSIHESAIQARRILRLESIGTLSTIFPQALVPTERRPSNVGGAPIGLMDYFGDCEPDSGNPTILAITIATSFKNVDAGSNITLSLRWHPPDQRWRSPASQPRFSLVGHLEDIDADTVERAGIASCFIGYHKDAAWWQPGNRIHKSKWVRLVVEGVYWIGGFGDRAYIGWIPVEEWHGVTAEEIDSIRLPGERRGVWDTWQSYLGLGREQ